MGNPQANLAAFDTSERPASPAPAAPEVEQPRDFHFAVTWVTLFAHLDLMLSNGPRQLPQGSPVLDLVPVPAPSIEPAAHGRARDAGRASRAGWEMVVPKMVRTAPGQFTAVDLSTSDAPGRDS